MNSAKPKKKLLVLLGAGASTDFGFPLTHEMREIMRDAEKFLINTYDLPACYTIIDEELQRHFGRTPNFEEVLHVLQVYNSFNSPSPLYNPIAGTFIWKCNLPRWPTRITKRFLEDIVGRLIAILCLKAYSSQERGSENIPLLKKFWEELLCNFQVGVASLNYDHLGYDTFGEIAREKTGEPPYTGFSSEESLQPKPFDKAFLKKASNQPWNFYYHLHGSIYLCFPFKKSEREYELHWRDLPHEGRDGPVDSENLFKAQGLRPSIFIAGGDKLQQIQPSPYFEYFTDFCIKLHNADALMIIGYGFGDKHINTALRRALAADSGLEAPKPVAVIKKNRQSNFLKCQDRSQDEALRPALGLDDSSPLVEAAPTENKPKQLSIVTHNGRALLEWRGSFAEFLQDNNRLFFHAAFQHQVTATN